MRIMTNFFTTRKTNPVFRPKNDRGSSASFRSLTDWFALPSKGGHVLLRRLPTEKDQVSRPGHSLK